MKVKIAVGDVIVHHVHSLLYRTTYTTFCFRLCPRNTHLRAYRTDRFIILRVPTR